VEKKEVEVKRKVKREVRKALERGDSKGRVRSKRERVSRRGRSKKE
jgi:hypothetical protein